VVKLSKEKDEFDIDLVIIFMVLTVILIMGFILGVNQ